MSRRAALIKQRQLEARLRQKKEIEERDLARQQKEYGHSKSQVATGDIGPKSMQDLFKARFKPRKNSASPSANPDNDAEAARLKLYEQKRARFLAKKKAQQQRGPINQQPQHIQRSIDNYQRKHSPKPEETASAQPTQYQQQFHHPSHSQKPYILQVSPPPSIKPQRPQVTFSEDKYDNPSYTASNDSIDSAVQRISNKDAQFNEWQQKQAKQEQYKMELMEQMNQKQLQSQNRAVDSYPNISRIQQQNEYNAMQQKKAKQAEYRQSLLQQQQMKQQKNAQMDMYHQDNGMNASFGKMADANDKKLKQEQYRMELMQQMQMKKKNEIQIKPHHPNTNNHSAQPFASFNNGNQNEKESKRAKQEKYRMELEEQMRQRKAQQARRSDFNHAAAEMKEKEDLDEMRRQKYAMELEQQMEFKRLSKMAEKEKELLEDRRNTMNGSFLDGFGNNPIPKKTQPQISTQNIYKSELDMQRKSYLEQERLKASMNANEPYQALPYQDPSKDAKLEKMNQYKRDLDEQRRQLQQRKEAQKQKEMAEALRLEQKIKNDRDELLKQKANEDRDGGIFGSSAEQQKMKKAKKMEAYQQELRKQSEEAKRKREEKERKAKEEEKRLEMKIKREMKELEDRYKAEKERESMANSPTKASKIGNQTTVLVPPKKRTPKVTKKKENVLPRLPEVPMDNKQHLMNDKPLSARKSSRPSSANSSKLFAELLSLKQDLLQNQEMIRKELQIHKEQIHQQMVAKNAENTTKPKSFEDEMNKYHNRITNEIEDLKKAIIKQRNVDKQKQRTYPHSARSAHSSRPRSRKQRKKEQVELESFDHQLSVKNHSKFVMPTAPPTPALIRPETGMTVFSMNDNDDDDMRNLTRLNTGLTELGVDEYLLKESKKNNEYLQFTSNRNSRLHTPNIYKIDSIERDLFSQQYKDATVNVRNPQKNVIDNKHLMEKSIRSKSDFLYNVMVSKQEDERNERRRSSNDKSMQSNDSMLSKLLTKNQNRLQYFRQTTPLDATRSMKLGLQKIEDLLDQTERLNASHSKRKKYKTPRRSSREKSDFDDSLFELM